MATAIVESFSQEGDAGCGKKYAQKNNRLVAENPFGMMFFLIVADKKQNCRKRGRKETDNNIGRIVKFREPFYKSIINKYRSNRNYAANHGKPKRILSQPTPVKTLTRIG